MSIVLIGLSIVLLVIVIGLLPDPPAIPNQVDAALDTVIEYTDMMSMVGQYMFGWIIWNGLVALMIVNIIAIPVWKGSMWVYEKIMEAKG